MGPEPTATRTAAANVAAQSGQPAAGQRPADALASPHGGPVTALIPGPTDRAGAGGAPGAGARPGGARPGGGDPGVPPGPRTRGGPHDVLRLIDPRAGTGPRVDCTRRKCVALTFDDGPGRHTDRLLRTLAAHKARATFFMVGSQAVQYPATARRVMSDGHELGNHSYSHADLGRASKKKVEAEIARTQAAVRQATGVTPRLFRPPYGSTDKAVAAVAARHALPQIIWNVDTFDWRDRKSATVARRVIGQTRPGSIVLMHDIHGTTVAALPRILDRLAAKGYVFVTVSELGGKPLRPGKKYTKR